MVEVAAAAEAFAALVNDPELRRKMGDAGRARVRVRVRCDYDWQVIVCFYQDLWRDLANIRNRTVEVAPKVQGRVSSLFQNYPSGTIDGDEIVSLSDPARVNFNFRLAEMRVMMMN